MALSASFLNKFVDVDKLKVTMTSFILSIISDAYAREHKKL